MFCHLIVRKGGWTGEIKKTPSSSYLCFYVMQFCLTPSALLITTEHTTSGKTQSTHISSFCRLHQKTLEGHGGYVWITAAAVFNQLTLCLWSKANAEVRSKTHHREQNVSATLCDLLHRWSEKTPGRFQPDQSVQTGLAPDKQHAIPPVRSTAVGSGFCLRNAPAQKKYWHSQEWAALYCSILPALSRVFGSVRLTRSYQWPLYLI